MSIQHRSFIPILKGGCAPFTPAWGATAPQTP
ncbi:MAG: hypothetical protein EZS28_033659, partial [Streblomastix strix]